MTHAVIRYSATGERIPASPPQSDSKPNDAPPSVEFRLQEIQNEIHSLRQGHQENTETLRQLARDMREILSFVRGSSSSSGTTSGTTTSLAPTDGHHPA